MLSHEDRILAELLVARGLVTWDDLGPVIEATESGERFGATLVGSGLVSSADLDQASASLAIVPAQDGDTPLGARIGEFRLIRELGRGSMGIVYEAVQEGLERRVALKVLPVAAALDPRRKARFLREARTAARLRHPALVPVHTLGSADGVLYFTMEFVEGRSLQDEIFKGALEPRRAASVAAPVARAAGWLHAHGVIHRDIKPSNILLDHAGRARLSDLGLVHDPEGGALTATAAVVGTPDYMAPECATGSPADPRSDVYSLGAVLYAMLAGRAPFDDGSSEPTLLRVASRPPRPIESVVRGVPGELARIVTNAMARRPQDRYAHADELAEDLDRFLGGKKVRARPARGGGTPPWAGSSRRARTLRTVMVAAAIVLPLSVAAIAVLRSSREPAISRVPVTRLAKVTSLPGREMSPSLSPDGLDLAFASAAGGNWDVYVQPATIDQPATNVTSDCPAYDATPDFSPDGRRIAFRSDRDGGGIFVMDRDGRNVTRLTSAGFDPAWSPDGREIAYATAPTFGPNRRVVPSELWLAEVDTGTARRVNDGDAAHPAWAPSGELLVFARTSAKDDHGNLWVVRRDGAAARPLTSGPFADWAPEWAPDGRHVYFVTNRAGPMNVWRIAVDPATGEPRGEAEPVTAGVQGEALHLSLSAEGRKIAFASWNSRETLRALRLSPSSATPAGTARRLSRFPEGWHSPSPAPDAKRIVLVRAQPHEDLVVARTDGSDVRLLTQDSARDRAPRWSPRGDEIIFHSDRGGSGMDLWSIAPDGTGLRRLTDMKARGAVLPVWSPDGSHVAFSDDRGASYIIAVPPRKARDGTATGAFPTPQPVPSVPGTTTPFTAWSWSADGSNLAGTADGIVLYDIASRAYRRLTSRGDAPAFLGASGWLLAWDDRALTAIDSRSEARHEIVAERPDTAGRFFGLSSDGRDLYFTVSSSDAQIWVGDLAD